MRRRVLRQARRVAIYLGHASELDTAPLLRALHRRGLAVYIPEVLPSQRMSFVRLRPGTPLRRGRLGLRQPAIGRPRCNARQLQIILLPLLGFDHRGRRLGQGGGYYDRALAGCRNRFRPLRVGYAYAVQQVDAVPADDWDIGLDMVVTEQGVRRFHRP